MNQSDYRRAMAMPTTCRTNRVLCLVFLSLASSAAARTWTNDQGETLDAEFVRLRGTTAFLRAETGVIRAPVNRLSETDQQWIEQYKEYAGPRTWGAERDLARGRFQDLGDDQVEVRVGRETLAVPLAELAPEDFAHLESLYKHLEKPLPDSFEGAKRAAGPALPTAPPENAVERSWIDTRGRKLTAKFGGTAGQDAILWRGDKRFEFPLARLSAADQAWVAEQNLKRLASDLAKSWSAATSIAMNAAAQSGPGGPPRRPPPPPPRGQPPQQGGESLYGEPGRERP